MKLSGMKYIGRNFFLAAVLLATAGRPLLAQSNFAPTAAAMAPAPSTDSDQSSDSILTIKARVSEVNVLFIATDKHGKFVRNLNQDDFTILDDNKPPQSIVDFRRETDLPLEIGLLVDTSGSVRARFDFEQAAALSFMQQTLRPHFDQAFVMGFASHSQVTQDFTDNLKLLQTGVQTLHDGGGTALFDAIYRASREKLSKEKDDHPVRHALIVISDGDDNQSEVTRTQALEMAQRADVIIYAISTNDSPNLQRGDKVLQQLADATGGRAFFPYNTKDITHSFKAIEDELRSQYIISYRPADFDADGRYRAIAITAQKKDLEVRARKGYYAPHQ